MPIKNVHFVTSLKTKNIDYKEDILSIIVDKEEENGIETEVMFQFSLNQHQKLTLLKNLEEDI